MNTKESLDEIPKDDIDLEKIIMFILKEKTNLPITS